MFLVLQVVIYTHLAIQSRNFSYSALVQTLGFLSFCLPRSEILVGENFASWEEYLGGSASCPIVYLLGVRQDSALLTLLPGD